VREVSEVQQGNTSVSKEAFHKKILLSKTIALVGDQKCAWTELPEV